MTDRSHIIATLLARAGATKRRVYGFSSQKAGCVEITKGKVPPDFDRLCVEGDPLWTCLPPAESESVSSAKGGKAA